MWSTETFRFNYRKTFLTKSRSRTLPLYIPIVFAICTVILIGNAISLYQNLQSLKYLNSALEKTWRATDRLQYINVLIMDAESSIRGYFMSDNKIYLGPLKTAKSHLDKEFAALDELLRDNPAQTKNLAQLRVLFNRKMSIMDDSINIYNKGGFKEILEIAKIGEGREVMDEIRLLVTIMVREQNDVQAARKGRFYNEYQDAVFLGIAINTVVIIVLILFYGLIRRNYFQRLAAETALQTVNDGLEKTVYIRTEQMSVLSRHLINVSEQEKAKLARDLHDELGACLTAINMDVASVMGKLKISEPALAGQLQRARETLLDTVNLKRRIIENLRPSLLDNLGLAISLRSHCEEFTKITGLPCEVTVSDEVNEIDPLRSIALFRITQESLTNITKYAHANSVKVALTAENNGLRLHIIDDGVGIAMDTVYRPMSHGILGMRERVLLLNGTFAIQNGANDSGTIIDVFIPAV